MPATAAARRASAERAGPARVAARRAQVASSRRRPSRARATSGRRRGITPANGWQIPVAVGQRTAVVVGGLADSGLIHRLTRDRLWILFLAALLAGIVALNVFSLSLSASASRVAAQADAVERENSLLRGRIVSGVSSEVRAAGEQAGLLMPAPDEIDYLRSDDDDAEIAAKRLRAGELSADLAPPPLPATEPAIAEAPPVEPVPVEPAPVAPVEPVAETVPETTPTPLP
jgi:hypothetical protein